MAYNGWTNYETWNVRLWLDNDEGSYRHVTGEAEQRHADAAEDDTKPDTYDFAQWLKGYVTDDLMPDLGASMASDLLTSALGEVNWTEIAEAFLSDAAENADA